MTAAEVNDPRKVRAIIENVKPHKGDHRIHLEASFPLGGNGDLVLMLLEQQGNPIELTISQPLQLRLEGSQKPAETETITTSVDGQEAKVTRTRRNGNKSNGASNPTAERLASFQEWANKPHVFVPSDSDDMCERCGRGQGMSVHEVPTWTELYERYLNDGEDRGAEMAAENAEDKVRNGEARPMTDEELALYRQLTHVSDEELDATAQSLIDESRRTPANPEEAREQEEAEAQLAARARA